MFHTFPLNGSGLGRVVAIRESRRQRDTNSSSSRSHARNDGRQGPNPHPGLQFIRNYAGICLIGMLIFSLVLATAGFVVSYATEKQTAALVSDGRTSIGTVTDKHIQTVSSKNDVYVLDVSFKTQEGRFHYGSTSVSKLLYGRFDAGQPVKVTYVESDPDQFYVADNAPTNPDATIFSMTFRYATITSLLTLIGLGVLVFWDGFAATPFGKAARMANPDENPLRLPRPQTPAGFGRRR